MQEKDLIKQKIDIVELVSEYVTLKKAGSNFKGLCPFHNEKTPSFMVNPELGIYKCFGCSKGGDCFNWLMDIENLNFHEALEQLAKRAGVPLTHHQPDHQSQLREQQLAALEYAKNFYHWLLTQHPLGKPALQYLENRRLSLSTIRTFQLGWAPDSWDGLYRHLTKQKNIPPPVTEQIGLCLPSPQRHGYYDRFRGRIVFPLNNHQGKTVGFSGRIVPFIDYHGKEGGKYINTPETSLYHKRELLYGLDITKKDIKQADTAIITEGEFDTLSSWQAGITNVVAIKGSALTEEHVHFLKRYATKIIFALDMDPAGDKAVRAGINLANQAGLEIRIIQSSQGKDPDEIARQDPQQWASLINNSVDIYQFFISSATKRHDPQTAHGKRKISQELLPLFAEIPSRVMQAHWLSELSKTLDLEISVLQQELRTLYHLPSRIKSSPVSSIPSPTNRRELLENLLLGRLLQNPDSRLFDDQVTQLFLQPWIHKVIELIKIKYRQSPHQLQLNQLDIPPELQLQTAQVLMQPDISSQPVSSVNQILMELKKIDLIEQRKNIRQQIIHLENSDSQDSQQLADLQKQFDHLNLILAQLQGNEV